MRIPHTKLGSALEGTTKVESLTEGPPPIFDVLGAQGMAPVQAVPRDGGRILWFNWALAEEMGIELSPDRKMSPDFEAKLLKTLNLEVLPAGEDPKLLGLRR